MNFKFGAEVKRQYLDTLKGGQKQDAEKYFPIFDEFEANMNRHIFEMSGEEFKAIVQMSDVAPSGIPSAKRLNTFAAQYWKWAKKQDLCSQIKNPFASYAPVELCTSVAVSLRYVASYDDLFEKLCEENPVGASSISWDYIVLGLLLVYEGIDHQFFDQIQYNDVDFEAKTIAVHEQTLALSDPTLSIIDTIHDYKRVLQRPGIRPIYANITNSNYVFPYGEKGIHPYAGSDFGDLVATHKDKRSVYLKDCDWFSVDSVKKAGEFYRIYTGKRDNTLDVHEQYLYGRWKEAYYPDNM